MTPVSLSEGLPETRIYEEALMAERVEGRLGSECLGLIERQVGVDRSAINKASPPQPY